MGCFPMHIGIQHAFFAEIMAVITAIEMASGGGKIFGLNVTLCCLFKLSRMKTWSLGALEIDGRMLCN